MIDTYLKQLGRQIPPGYASDFTAIARDNDPVELVKFLMLVIFVALNSSNNQQFVKDVQQLSEQDQHTLMICMEEMLNKPVEAVFLIYIDK